jgi:hypothetical protein
MPLNLKIGKYLIMKNRLKFNLRYALYFVLCVVLLSSCVERRCYDEEHILLITENAFLEGYKAALMKQHQDSAWNNVKQQYKFD